VRSGRRSRNSTHQVGRPRMPTPRVPDTRARRALFANEFGTQTAASLSQFAPSLPERNSRYLYCTSVQHLNQDEFFGSDLFGVLISFFSAPKKPKKSPGLRQLVQNLDSLRRQGLWIDTDGGTRCEERSGVSSVPDWAMVDARLESFHTGQGPRSGASLWLFGFSAACSPWP
jgi:hypothetical protein